MNISRKGYQPAQKLIYTLSPILLLTLLFIAHGPVTPLEASIPDEQPDHSTSPHSGPDLVVTSITIHPPNPQPGDTGDIHVTIQNIGDEATSNADIRILLYVNPVDIPPAEEARSDGRMTRGQALDPGETFTFKSTNHEFTSSNPVLYAWVDPPWMNNIAESNEENNGLRVPGGTPTPTPFPTPVHELNDECLDATQLVVNDSPQQHNLVPLTGSVDVDWIKFDAVPNRTYTVRIEAIGEDADLDVTYRAFCGDGGSLGSGASFDIESDQNGPYFLQIKHIQASYGPDTRYSVEVTSGTPDEFEYGEGDNECLAASLFTSLQLHNLVPLTGSVDEDWVKFDAVRDQIYTVRIEAIGEDADLDVTYRAYCGDGGSLGSGASFDIKSDQNSPYFLQIKHIQAGYGPDTRYSVVVATATPTPIFTPDTPTLTSTPPTNTPTPTDIPTNTPTPTPTIGLTSDPDATWTLFIYAIGDNNLHFDLGTGKRGMLGRFRKLQGEKVEGVRVVIMFDGSDTGDTKYYTMDEDGNWQTVTTDLPENAHAEARMDDPESLKNFLKWGFEKYSDSDYYALSILGHASGIIGIGPDYTSDSTGQGFLEPTEIRSAIQEVQEDQDNPGRHLHVVHFDGCSFGLFESTSILHGIASAPNSPTYVIASPDTGWGIFAHEVYRRLAGQSATPADYATKVAQHYGAALTEYGYFYTISAYDLAYFSAVQEATGNLGNALTAYIEENSVRNHLTLQDRRGKAQIYDSGNYIIDERKDTYVDLLGFTQALNVLERPTIDSAVADTQAALANFVIYEDSKTGWAPIEGGRVLHDLEDAQGMAIFYPYWAMEGTLWERYTGIETWAVSGVSQASMNNDPIYPGLDSEWGWIKFVRTIPTAPPTPLSPGSEPELPPEVYALSPLDSCELVECYTFLPTVMR